MTDIRNARLVQPIVVHWRRSQCFGDVYRECFLHCRAHGLVLLELRQQGPTRWRAVIRVNGTIVKTSDQFGTRETAADWACDWFMSPRNPQPCRHVFPPPPRRHPLSLTALFRLFSREIRA